MLIDAFTWFNETEMLLFRLKMLAPLVDKFVLVEADHTFGGLPKPYYSDRLDARFAPFREKLIIHKICVDVAGLDFSKKPERYDLDAPSWRLEHQQRNAIGEACRQFPDGALVIFGDVDEIPSREALEWIFQNKPGIANPLILGQFLFYYNLRFIRNVTPADEGKFQISFWKGSILTRLAHLLKTGAQPLRFRCNELETVNYGGWHLSYFHNAAGIRNKIESFSHQEFNREEFKDETHIIACMESGGDLYNRDTPLVPAERDFFPSYFIEYAPEEWW